MNKLKEETTSGGIGFLGLLTVLFIGLKLAGIIEWSWLWVLSPLWLPVAVGLGIAAVVLLFVLIVMIISFLFVGKVIRDNE